MDANAAFTPGSLPFTGAGVQAKLIQHDAARACAINAIPSCSSGLAPKGDWYLNDRATASVRRSGSTNIELHIHKGGLTERELPNDRAITRFGGLGVRFGSLGKVQAGAQNRLPQRGHGSARQPPLDGLCESIRMALTHAVAAAAWLGASVHANWRCGDGGGGGGAK